MLLHEKGALYSSGTLFSSHLFFGLPLPYASGKEQPTRVASRLNVPAYGVCNSIVPKNRAHILTSQK